MTPKEQIQVLWEQEAPGVLPQIIISTLGVLPFKAFWELYISSNHVLISSGINPGDLVIPV